MLTDLGEFDASGYVMIIKDYWFKISHVDGTGTGVDGMTPTTLSIENIDVSDSQNNKIATISENQTYQATMNLVVKINSRELLFDKLPEIFGKEIGKDLIKEIKRTKEVLDLMLDNTRSNLIEDTKRIFKGNENATLPSVLQDWVETLKAEKSMQNAEY